MGGLSHPFGWVGSLKLTFIVYEQYQKLYIHDLMPSFIPPNNCIDYYTNTIMIYYPSPSCFTDVKLGLREVKQVPVSHSLQVAGLDSVSSLSDSGTLFHSHMGCPGLLAPHGSCPWSSCRTLAPESGLPGRHLTQQGLTYGPASYSELWPLSFVTSSYKNCKR